MLNDILTVLWKELKELPSMQSGQKNGKVGIVIIAFVFGIMMPLQIGREWVTQPITVLAWAWVPFILVSSVIADSFAGERERHTLETLLASRLPDQAILFGKLMAGVTYGWGLSMGSMVISIFTVNIANWDGHVLLYPLNLGIAIVVVSLLVSLLSSGLGVLVSLRAATVRQAQQMFSLGFLLIFIPIMILPALPKEWQAQIYTYLAKAEFNAIIPWAVIVLVVIDIALIAASLWRFQRARLILS